jgi:glycosyltransferase involved in cell wall biosynthesis
MPVLEAHAAPEALITSPAGERGPAPFVSLVLPCFNESASLREFLPALQACLRHRFRHWEVVLVDDGSTDDSAAVLAEWALRPGFRVLMLSRNFGKEAALTAGIDAADGDVVILMDADGQHPAELIAPMVQRWQAGADVVYAARRNRDDQSVLMRGFSRAFYRLLNVDARVHIPDDAGDFRLMDRAVVDALRQLPERTRMMKGLYAWVGFRTEALPYEPAPRLRGQSRFRARRLLGLALVGVTAFTTWPLRLLSLFGSVMALLSLAYGAFVTVDFLLFGAKVSGWTTIVVLLLLLGGIQLLSLGLLGEYLARIFDEVKGRPLYLVRQRLGAGASGRAPQ